MIRTDTSLPAMYLRVLLGLEEGEPLKSSIPTHDGEWRLERNGRWRFWEHDDVAAERKDGR